MSSSCHPSRSATGGIGARPGHRIPEGADATWCACHCGTVRPSHDNFVAERHFSVGQPIGKRTSLLERSRYRHNAVVITVRLAAAIVASATLVGAAGCTATAEAGRPTPHVARVPNPSQITHFDLVAYDPRQPTSSSTSRLLGSCVVPDRGQLIQVGVSRSLAQLGVAHHGQGVGLLFQAGATAAGQRSVADCLRSHGATLTH